MALVSHALTTLARVKAKLTITGSSQDAVLESLISAATDWIESQCGRRFKETVYSNEVYGLDGEGGRFLQLEQFPVSALSSLQYRAGVPDNPSWTSFLTSEYELVGDGSSGLVRVYGGVPRGTNNIRASYTAGYKIDFANDTNPALHTLPFDLSELCERLAIKAFKKRETVGRKDEAAGEAKTVWIEGLEPEDKATLERYTRVYLP